MPPPDNARSAWHATSRAATRAPWSQVADEALPDTYDFTLTAGNQNDDGGEVVGTGWAAGVGSCLLFDINADGVGRGAGDYLAAWSFPAVGLTSCSSATLTVVVAETDAGGTFKVYGEKNTSVASAQWGGANLPSSKFAALATTAFANSEVNFTGAKVINVTAIVAEIMAGAGYAGGRINFWAEASSTFAFGTFGEVGSGTPARLQITA